MLLCFAGRVKTVCKWKLISWPLARQLCISIYKEYRLKGNGQDE